MDIAVLGIDLGKTVCSLAGLDRSGAVVFRRRIQRFRLLGFLADLPPCIVAMEACGGAHHTARFCLRHGHKPRLMSPLYVRPYVKVHKNDNWMKFYNTERPHSSLENRTPREAYWHGRDQKLAA